MIESALEAGFASAGVDVLLTGPLPTPGRRLPDAGAAAEPRPRHQRLAQPVSRTTASSSSRPAARSCPTTGSARSRRRWRSEPRWVGSARARQGAPARRRQRPLRRVLQEHLQQRAVAEGPEDRRRCRPRRGLSRRARRLPRARRRGHGHRLPARRHQHQRRLRRHRAGGAGRRGAGRAAPTTASRSTATPTGCRWSTPPAASTTATSCSTCMAADRLRAGRTRARRGRHADDQHRRRAARCASAGVQFVRAQVGDRYVLEELRRPRLAAGRRRLGPPARARPAHHRRRHRQRPAGAAGRASAPAVRSPSCSTACSSSRRR